jgi:hypothetical protein
VKVQSGHSTREDALSAVAEATEGWQDLAPQLVLAFCSTKQDPEGVAKGLAERFPRSVIAGCTTAGEHVGDRHFNGALVVSSVSTEKMRFSLAVARDLKHFDAEAARALSDELLGKLGVARDALRPDRHFCLTFMDGLSLKEESVASLMADALEGIPLAGGSAGDDLQFKKTQVIAGGQALSDAAVFVVAESELPFEVIKHQHYTTTPRSLVITKADVDARRVYEMDGYPALEAYARALDLKVEQVTGDVTFLNPVTFVCDNQIYVRSIQRIEPDGSIVFYCGIEEGMVLSVGGHEDMQGRLESDLRASDQASGQADLFIACNCILRALEAKQAKLEEPLAKVLSRFSRNVIGFDTYGEQLHGLHINQTLVGIALRDPSAAGERA